MPVFMGISPHCIGQCPCARSKICPPQRGPTVGPSYRLPGTLEIPSPALYTTPCLWASLQSENQAHSRFGFKETPRGHKEGILNLSLLKIWWFQNLMKLLGSLILKQGSEEITMALQFSHPCHQTPQVWSRNLLPPGSFTPAPGVLGSGGGEAKQKPRKSRSTIRGAQILRDSVLTWVIALLKESPPAATPRVSPRNSSVSQCSNLKDMFVNIHGLKILNHWQISKIT